MDNKSSLVIAKLPACPVGAEDGIAPCGAPSTVGRELGIGKLSPACSNWARAGSSESETTE
eukprot:5200918-Amphidinium_carterae.1